MSTVDEAAGCDGKREHYDRATGNMVCACGGACAREDAATEGRWNEAIDWLLNSHHTADPDIQDPFWAYVDGLITRDELEWMSAAHVDARKRGERVERY